MIEEIAYKEEITPDEALRLLQIENNSAEYYQLLYAANRYSEQRYKKKGYVFAQIGVNTEPCSANCKFCSMASSHYLLPVKEHKPLDQVVAEAKALLSERISDLFIMTTADYPQSRILQIGAALSPLLKGATRLVANIGDFDRPLAEALRQAGFTGAYHIVRLGEGTDTGLAVETREHTIHAIIEAGLELYYCIEPIGPEHSYAEILREMFRAKDLRIPAMAVMRRTAVKGTPLFPLGEISTPELCKIAAVTLLVVKPSRSMNVHEVTEMSLLAGINQLYAEYGANPRDLDVQTEQHRGYSVEAAVSLLEHSGHRI